MCLADNIITSTFTISLLCRVISWSKFVWFTYAFLHYIISTFTISILSCYSLINIRLPFKRPFSLPFQHLRSLLCSVISWSKFVFYKRYFSLFFPHSRSVISCYFQSNVCLLHKRPFLIIISTFPISCDALFPDCNFCLPTPLFSKHGSKASIEMPKYLPCPATKTLSMCHPS